MGKIKEASKAIEKNVMRISKIIKSMRIVARDATMDPMTDYKLNEILNDVKTLSQERFQKENINLKIAPADPNLSIHCRSPEVCQVLINLLNNAFDAVQDQPQKEVQIDWALKGKEIIISVSDSGPGVPAKIRDQIYEPFFTSKPVGKGTGLGLSISKSLVENHGGHMWLDESSSQTRFVFSLPLAD
jgi:C4-dicarboxylate-specific signal transduction histidine kinase